MKNKILIAIITIIGIIVILDIGVNYSFKDNVLYSQKDVYDYTKIQQDNYGLITRQKAIDKATKVFKDGLNIDLEGNDAYENVKLYKNSKDENKYKWSISWKKDSIKGKQLKDIYTCEIDSITGEIISMNINKCVPYDGKVYELNEKDMLEIMGILTNELDINLDNYDFKSTEYIKDQDRCYKKICMENKNNKVEVFIITIDCGNKSITSYTSQNG